MFVMSSNFTRLSKSTEFACLPWLAVEVEYLRPNILLTFDFDGEKEPDEEDEVDWDDDGRGGSWATRFLSSSEDVFEVDANKVDGDNSVVSEEDRPCCRSSL